MWAGGGPSGQEAVLLTRCPFCKLFVVEEEEEKKKEFGLSLHFWQI